jgi:hypothetical protein
MYRVQFTAVTLTTCTGGGSTPHVQYTDDYGLKDIGMLSTPYDHGNGTAGSSTFGTRVLQSTGATPLDFWVAGTVCTGGTGPAEINWYFTVERLQ